MLLEEKRELQPFDLVREFFRQLLELFEPVVLALQLQQASIQQQPACEREALRERFPLHVVPVAVQGYLLTFSKLKKVKCANSIKHEKKLFFRFE